jgi:hypothetical protein
MSVEGSVKREASPEQVSLDQSIKRARIETEEKPEVAPPTTETGAPLIYPHTRPDHETIPIVVSRMGLKPELPVMPASLELVTGVKADLRVRKGFVGQEEVGILGYAGDPAFKGVKGVIKQRLVLEPT